MSNMKRKTWRLTLWFPAAFGLFWLAGCGTLQTAKVPLDTLRYVHSDVQRSCCLVVFLPGRWDSPAQYERAQFIDTVRQADVSVDMVAVKAHYGYYASRTVVVRLREDVIAPALAQGYAQIWLVGVSMGGLGALLYLRDYPDDIAGVVALAPFLGDTDIVQEITRAGGLWQWQPPSISPGDYQRELWQWLKTYLRHHGEAPPLYLGYGQQDRFAPANGLLARYLPETQVLTTPGGHEWSTWRALWKTFLRTSVALHVAPESQMRPHWRGSPRPQGNL